MSKLEKAFQLFDDYNRNDPTPIIWEGITYSAEYFYALQLYNWVMKLEPEANEYLQLASRAQHIGRWQTPRNQYPDGKAGYLTWRKDLAKFHAATAAGLLQQAGYTDEEIEHVQHIILKQDLKVDAEVQTMENALCLVFLQYQYEDFVAKHDDDKIIRILRKTWRKMSEDGQKAALTLTYKNRGKLLIEKALEVQ